jgi:hypothetical protein
MLANLGGITGNSLNSILEQNEIDTDEEPKLIIHSPYYDNEMFIETIKNKQNVIKCISINIQSLNAKIDQLRIYINLFQQHDVKVEIILLQETWLSRNSDTSQLQIDGYNFISQPFDVTSHGGLAMYVLKDIDYELLEVEKSQSGIWEGQFLKLKLNETKLLTIGNIYRPPRDLIENYTNFKTEFENILRVFNGNVLIGGDFNIDLLKLTEKSIINEYFESVLSNGFIPKITLPTRLTRNNGTLIDNFLCKISDDFSFTTAGILSYKLSDHQPIFICLDFMCPSKKNPKIYQNYKKRRKFY